MASKRRKKKKEVSVSLPVDGLGKVGEHLDRPLFLAPLAALVLASVKPLSGGFLRDSTPLMMAALFLWTAATILRDKRLKKDYWSIGIPVLLFLTALFSHYSNTIGFPLNEDYTYFSAVAAVFALGYSLSYHGVVKAEVAGVAALFLSGMITHMAPAKTDYLAALDPYWHYKWMRGIYDGGYPPEFDPLVYPLLGGLAHSNDPSAMGGRAGMYGLDQSSTRMMTPVLYSSLALALEPFGISLHDVAMLLPGAISAFTVVIMYLLVKEMFTDMRPYNKVAAFMAAFMLILSPAFAMKAVATNSEDDALGMFLLVSTLYLFFAGYHRRSFKYAAYSGVAFLMLNVAWGGAQYAFLTLGAFGTAYAFVNFLHKRNAVEALPYILIPVFIAQLGGGLILHERGGLPALPDMTPNAVYPIIAAVGASIVLELLRVRMYGEDTVSGDSVESRTVNLMGKNIMVLGVVALVAGTVAFTFFITPSSMIDFVINGLMSARTRSVVHMTVSEQNPLAGSFQEFLAQGYNRYGIALLYGLMMIPVLAYLVYRKGSVGALFLLTWSLPMLWGAYHKSAWIFASSTAVTALGATIGLFAVVKREDLESLRVVGAIMVLFIPVFYVPLLGATQYNKFVGYQVMHMGATSDRYYWEPALQWHEQNTDPGDAILTWWDYGHWFTSVSQRPVLIDNLQADYYEIQDVARFFVNKTSEEEAFKIVEEYNEVYEKRGMGLNYVTIDWTMVPKGSALHFIATGVIENVTPGSFKNYVQCSFLPDQSQVEEQLVVDDEGNFRRVKQVVFGCQGYIAGVVFEIVEDSIADITVIGPYGNRIPWNSWRDANDASLLGVVPLVGYDEQRIPSIMACALNWKQLPEGSICRMPQFRTLVYVPQEFNDFMITRLYLGRYLDEYRALGLYNREVEPLEHFRLVPDYDGDGSPDGDFSWGFVRSYEISYDGFASTTSASETILTG